mgnify:CR=1 FL=1
MYKWQRIKALHAQGVSIRQIARTVGVSRNTVKKYLREAGPPQFKARKYVKELDNYQEEIEDMLAKGFIGTRIFNELTDMGYKGSLSSVHRYLRAIKEDDKITKLATTRVETGPGLQMQYDWKEWMLPVAGKPVKIYLHEVVLSYSRMKFYTFSLRITTADVIRALTEAIAFFGGYALELVMDNGKQMVITHQKDGVIRYNDEFLRFCGLYGIEPSPCANYRAQTKGKVERPFYYVQEHLLRGLEVKDLDEFSARLSDFQDTYNQRPHSTLGRPPLEMFTEEKGCLSPIPLVEPALLFQKEPRKVSNDGYVSYGGNFYPVPMRCALRRVWVENIYGRHLRVYDEAGRLLAEFDLEIKKQTVRPPHPEHETINRHYQEKKLKARSVLVQKFTTAYGEDGQRYLEGLRKECGANLYWHLAEILSYQELYSPEDITAAIKKCLEIGSFHKNSVKRFLEQRKVAPLPPVDGQLKLNLPLVTIKRDLSCYAFKGSEVGAVP